MTDNDILREVVGEMRQDLRAFEDRVAQMLVVAGDRQESLLQTYAAQHQFLHESHDSAHRASAARLYAVLGAISVVVAALAAVVLAHYIGPAPAVVGGAALWGGMFFGAVVKLDSLMEKLGTVMGRMASTRIGGRVFKWAIRRMR